MQGNSKAIGLSFIPQDEGQHREDGWYHQKLLSQTFHMHLPFSWILCCLTMSSHSVAMSLL